MRYRTTFRTDNTLPLIICAAALLLIAGCVADNAAGSFNVAEATACAKRYEPPRTEVYTRWVPGDDDSPGRMQIYTEHIPAKYRLITGDGIELLVTSGQYARISERERIIIRHKVGRWTGIHYPWALADVRPAVER